ASAVTELRPKELNTLNHPAASDAAISSGASTYLSPTKKCTTSGVMYQSATVVASNTAPTASDSRSTTRLRFAMVLALRRSGTSVNPTARSSTRNTDPTMAASTPNTASASSPRSGGRTSRSSCTSPNVAPTTPAYASASRVGNGGTGLPKSGCARASRNPTTHRNIAPNM